jgi:hypothetical protein
LNEKSSGWNQTIELKKEKKRKGELMISRTKMQARVRHRVQPKDSICFKESKLVRIQSASNESKLVGIQFASNESKLVRIQFVSNESKLVPRNSDPESPSTLGISLFSVFNPCGEMVWANLSACYCWNDLKT